MLLKFAGVKTQYAVGLRWAVDDRSGIEAIQFNTDLHYGIMLEIKEKISRKLKLVALCDASHNKAICLSGLLASQFKNLILVHRVSDSIYWVCVVKNNTVWSGMDVPKATAGDFLGDYLSVNEVVEIARAEFIADGIDVQEVMHCTDTASEDYPTFKKVDFFTFVTKLKKNSKYIIRYLQPSKILIRKIIIVVVLAIGVIVGAYYIQQQRLITRLIHQQQIEEERQRQLAIQQKINYFASIQKTIRYQVGYAVLDNVLLVLNLVPLQSQGWSLVAASYNVQSPLSLALNLSRSDYGTLDSFLYAYSKTAQNGMVGQDNNTGEKTFSATGLTLKEGPIKISQESLTQSIPRERYRLISYMQLNQGMFGFQLKDKTKSQYGVNSATFAITGDKLWKLIQLKKALISFPTLTINKIKFTVNDYDMSWTIEGEIYA